MSHSPYPSAVPVYRVVLRSAILSFCGLEIDTRPSPLNTKIKRIHRPKRGREKRIYLSYWSKQIFEVFENI